MAGIGRLETAGEVHADSGASGPGLFGRAVQPVALGAAAHHDEGTAFRAEAVALACWPWLDQEPP